MVQPRLIHSLDSLRRRVRFLSVLFGTGVVVCCCVLLLLATVFCDYLFNLPALPRVVLIVTAIGTAGFAMWYWMIRLAMSRISLGDIASRIEQTFPQYQDRLRSTVDILTGKELPGSEVMKQRVVSEATLITQSLDLSSVVVTKPVTCSATAALSALLLLAALIFTAQNDYLKAAYHRLSAPFAANPWPKQVVIEQIGALPDRLALGGHLDLNIRLSRGQSSSRKVVVYFQYGDEAGTHFGPVDQQFMTRADDGTYHASIDARLPAGTNGTVKIWMESGDGRKELPPVRIVQRLAILSVQAVVTPPPYANLPPARVNLSQNSVNMPEGSSVQLTAVFNKTLDSSHPVSVELLTPKTKPVFAWQPVNGASAAASVQTAESFRFRLHATDTDGFANTAAEEFELVVRPDQPPTVSIESPRTNQDHTAESVIDLAAVAEDDFGIQDLTLSVDRLGDTNQAATNHWEIPLLRDSAPQPAVQWSAIDSTSELRRYRAAYPWDLPQLPGADLHPGDVLEYYVYVKDNYDLNGKTHAPVASGKLRIQIISQEEFSTRMTDELSTAAEQVKTLRQLQGSALSQTTNLAKQIAGKAHLDDADKALLGRLSDQQGAIASQTKSLSDRLVELKTRMQQNRSTNQELQTTAREVAQLMSTASESSMKDASAALDATRGATDPKDRDKAIADAQTNQTSAGDMLQKAVDRMGSVGSLARTVEKLDQLLAAQQKLSQETADAQKLHAGLTRVQLSVADRGQLDDLAKQQRALAAQTAEMLKGLARDAHKLASTDSVAATAMTHAAESARQADITTNQNAAAQAIQQNQQSLTQAGQTQAEQGMQQMLQDLHDAEKQKLDQLTQQLAEAQQLLQTLIREQAEHNLDNLNLQGPDALSGIDDPTRKTLFDSAQRDPAAAMPPIQASDLISQQQQTERNARDTAKSLEDLPQGAEQADLVTDAADQMERAAISLSDGKLADAYSPAQVNALADLIKAKSKIDQQKDEADQKNDEQKKLSLTEAFTQLLAQQTELNKQTVAIDSVPKEDDGSLSRTAALKLSQLSFAQGKLADKAGESNADLSTLGSIAYSFANQEIIKDMHDVKDRLSGQQTGDSTQQMQQQIVGELQAMIRDLKPQPKKDNSPKKDPANNSSGSMEGPPPPPDMPSEAELRLLKDLQLVENNATAVLSKQAPADKQSLLALADRQEQLRQLLDKVLQKASKGKSRLRPETEITVKLPEESFDAGTTAASAPLDPKDVNRIGDRMARVRQRLVRAGDDIAITQRIQNRIVENLDQLIELNRKKQTPPPPPSKPKPTTQQSKPKKPAPSIGAQPQNSTARGKKPGKKPGNKPGDGSDANPAQAPDLTANLDKPQEGTWGAITPRQRDAVIESQNEKVLDKYRDLVNDYYRTMSDGENQP